MPIGDVQNMLNSFLVTTFSWLLTIGRLYFVSFMERSNLNPLPLDCYSLFHWGICVSVSYPRKKGTNISLLCHGWHFSICSIRSYKTDTYSICSLRLQPSNLLFIFFISHPQLHNKLKESWEIAYGKRWGRSVNSIWLVGRLLLKLRC